MKIIAIVDSGHGSYEYEKRVIAEHGYQLKINENLQAPPEKRIEFAGDAVGILVRGTVIDESALQKMPLLKAIVRYGVGYDNVDVDAAKARGIRVSNVQGYGNNSVSDHAMALMYACTRNLIGNRKSTFGKPARMDVIELHDKSLGIIGIGRIGSHFSRKASPLFRQTLAYDPYKTKDYMKNHGAEKADLADLLKRSHVISLHCNLTVETRHLLNDFCFNQMENRPVIINTSRGPVIYEPDLLKALNNDLVHSAGLDVYENEPPGRAQEKLLDHDRVVATPHIAWYSDKAAIELKQRAADNLIGLLTGKKISDEL